MSEQSRKEFEDWATSQNIIRLDLTKVFGMQRWWYCQNETTAAYTAWQASRQSLVVKLPELFNATFCDAYEADAMKEALDAAGVKYE